MAPPSRQPGPNLLLHCICSTERDAVPENVLQPEGYSLPLLHFRRMACAVLCKQCLVNASGLLHTFMSTASGQCQHSDYARHHAASIMLAKFAASSACVTHAERQEALLSFLCPAGPVTDHLLPAQPAACPSSDADGPAASAPCILLSLHLSASCRHTFGRDACNTTTHVCCTAMQAGKLIPDLQVALVIWRITNKQESLLCL